MVFHKNLTGDDLHIAKMNTGAGSPSGSVNAAVIGEAYWDTTNNVLYVAEATGTGNWVEVTGNSLSDPMTSRGDIVVRNASNATDRLAIGANGQVLSSDGTDITWTTPSGVGDVVASAVMTDNAIVRGDGGAKGVQDTGITIDDSDSVSGMVLDADNNTISNIGTAELDTGVNSSLGLADSALQDITGEAIGSLSDVSISSVGDNELLTYDTSSGDWINQTAAEVGIAPIADPTFTGEIGIGAVNVSETELGILEGATVTTTELNYVSGVTSGIQSQLNAKGTMSNLSEDTTPELGGELDAGAHTIGFTLTDNGNSSTADTIDWGASNKQKSTLTDNCTFTFTAPSNPCTVQLILIQDGTGSRTVTWPASVKWPGGTAPTLSTAASSVDVVSLFYDGTNYYGTSSLAFS